MGLAVDWQTLALDGHLWSGKNNKELMFHSNYKTIRIRVVILLEKDCNNVFTYLEIINKFIYHFELMGCLTTAFTLHISLYFYLLLVVPETFKLH